LTAAVDVRDAISVLGDLITQRFVRRRATDWRTAATWSHAAVVKQWRRTIQAAGMSALRARVRSWFVNVGPELDTAQEVRGPVEEQHKQLSHLRDLDHVYKLLQERRPESLHLNGCGDFQLMARENWLELRGYPEFETFSMN